jgi:hypothetical protein
VDHDDRDDAAMRLRAIGMVENGGKEPPLWLSLWMTMMVVVALCTRRPARGALVLVHGGRGRCATRLMVDWTAWISIKMVVSHDSFEPERNSAAICCQRIPKQHGPPMLRRRRKQPPRSPLPICYLMGSPTKSSSRICSYFLPLRPFRTQR